MNLFELLATACRLTALERTCQKKMPVTQINGETEYSLAAEWGHKYVFDSTLEELDLSFAGAPPAGVASEIVIVIYVGDTVPQVTTPETLVVDGDDMSFGERYELSINEELYGIGTSTVIPAAPASEPEEET